MAIIVTRTAPPAPPTSVSAQAVHGWRMCYNEESGILVDRTTEFTTIGTDVNSFATVDDYVYFSVEIISQYTDERVIHVHVALSTLASASIEPTFEYSRGDDLWVAIPVTDGTNGFTQDGSIIVDFETIPYSTWWIPATKDGNGNTIGDGVARTYLRVRRTASTLTTPPQISECGSGCLTANTTYYYRAVSVLHTTIYGNDHYSRRWSAPCSEVSATTTTIKRTIRIDLDTAGSDYLIWRAATSGEYGTTVSQYACTENMDIEGQPVKAHYFYEQCGTGGADSYIIDNGPPDRGYYVENRGLYFNYTNYLYTGVERGDLFVDTTDSDVAAFYDLWLECQSQGWTDALVRFNYPHVADSVQRRRIYRMNDNLDISGDFADMGVTLYMLAALATQNCTSATFGRRLDPSPYHYDTGVHFIVSHGISFQGKFNFQNTLFYSCKFTAAAIGSSRHYAEFPLINDDCELYDCVLDGYENMQRPSFLGDNLVLKNVMVSEARYGLAVLPSTYETSVIEDITIQGGDALTNLSPYFQDGETVTFLNFTFKNIGYMMMSYAEASNWSDVTLNFVNPTLINSDIATARGGRDWIYNEQYTFDMLVLGPDGETPLDGVTVRVVDAEGAEVFSVLTGGTGEIVQQVVTYKQYTGGTLIYSDYQYLADDVTLLAPHTVTISKSGYATRELVYDIDRPIEQVEMLEPPVFADTILAELGEDSLDCEVVEPEIRGTYVT